MFQNKDVKAKFDRLNELTKQRKKIYNLIDQTQEGVADLIKRKEVLHKKIHKTYNTSDLVPKGLKELRRKLETSSGTNKEEAVLIKEIELIKASVPIIEEKEKIEIKLSEC